MTREAHAVTILTSGVGLGTYVPALLIQHQLRARGVAANVEVLEGLFLEQRQRAHLANKQAFADDFDLALMAHRMVRDISDSLDPDRIDALLARWNDERLDRFIVWSGFWLPVLDRYRTLAGQRPLHVDLCRIDAEVSASFRIYPELGATGKEIWLWNGSARTLAEAIPVRAAPIVRFRAREHRLVVHGGGWNLGTYKAAIPALRGAGYALDIVVRDRDEAAVRGPGDRCFIVDPAWNTWDRDDCGELQFPPVSELKPDGRCVPLHAEGYHAFFDIVANGKAVVSKPGGGTLIDSLAAATPVIVLDPYGYAERSNGDVWQTLGYGLSWTDWQAGGMDTGTLAAAHARLLQKPHGRDYPARYAREVSGAPGDAMTSGACHAHE